MRPNDLQLKIMNLVHKTAITVSGGRLGWTAGKMPALELTTTGRKTGQPRSVMLTSPVQRGDTIVIVASKGGNDHHPAWYLNLVDHPEVTVKYQGGRRRPMRARTATTAERAELWPQITTAYRGYAGYQDKTDRTIPVVLLDPA
jgi:deazaflavin-dependent oxidoreductase (nitroreductase family)